MNTHKFKFILLLILSLGIPFSSCNDYLDVNVDPNQSTISRIDLQLSSAQVQTAIGIGQRIFPQMAIFCQYYTGGPGVALGDPDQHKWPSSESNEVFTRLYRSSINLDYIVKNSRENYYIAIAKIMKAYNFQVCVDLFGNIPYTDALRGDIADGSILHPAYDDARAVYDNIEKELLEAIATIEAGGAFLHPSGDDLIYAGDTDNWGRFARTLLLKVYLRQAEDTGNAANAAKAETDAKALLASTGHDASLFITLNSENAQVSFPGGASGSNPFWTAAKSTALGNFYIATENILNYLNATTDPRIDAFFDRNSTGSHLGLKPGDIQNTTLPNSAFTTPDGAQVPTGSLIFSPTAPVILMSAWEGNLLLSEAAQRGWTTIDRDAAYAAGVEASFEYLGLDAADATTYLAGAGALDPANPIKSIALQKWTCMNGLQTVESWIETRRFDSPSRPIFSSSSLFIPPTKNSLGGNVFPSILPYPENEESLNQNFPGQHPITGKVFWDN